MDAGVGGELGVEGGGEDVAGADEGGKAVAGGEGLDRGAGAGDARGADEDHLQRRAGERGGRCEDGGVDLAAVGVALDGDVERAERALGGGFDMRGEKDGPGAGAEGGRGADVGLQQLEEAVAVEEAEHGGGFAAGQNESVEGVEVWRKTDQARGCAEGGERADVGVVGALEGEDADERRVERGFGHFGELAEGLLAAGAGVVTAGAGAAAGDGGA